MTRCLSTGYSIERKISIPDLSEETYHTYIGKEVSIVTSEKEKVYQEVLAKIILFIFSRFVHFCTYFFITNRIINDKFLMLNL